MIFLTPAPRHHVHVEEHRGIAHVVRSAAAPTVALRARAAPTPAPRRFARLRRVMEAARLGHIGAVLVRKLDCFGRSALDLQANGVALADAGVRFEAVPKTCAWTRCAPTLWCQLPLTTLSRIAAFEPDIISDRPRARIGCTMPATL